MVRFLKGNETDYVASLPGVTGERYTRGAWHGCWSWKEGDVELGTNTQGSASKAVDEDGGAGEGQWVLNSDLVERFARTEERRAQRTMYCWCICCSIPMCAGKRDREAAAAAAAGAASAAEHEKQQRKDDGDDDDE